MEYIIFIDFTYEAQYSIMKKLSRRQYPVLKSAHVHSRKFYEGDLECSGMYGD